MALFTPQRAVANQRSKLSPTAIGPKFRPRLLLLSGALLFGGPAVAVLFHVSQLDSSSVTVSLALTPIVVAITVSALGIDSSDGLAGRIWPGLAAVSGLLLLLAQPVLGDFRDDVALVLAPALTGAGAALFCLAQPSAPSRIGLSSVTLALAGAAALLALVVVEGYIFSGFRPSLSLLAIAVDGLLALLSVASLSQLGATRWSSQFTWIPLLIVGEGIAMVRPQLTANWIAGLVLLAIASIYLLLPPGKDQDPAPSIIDS